MVEEIIKELDNSNVIEIWDADNYQHSFSLPNKINIRVDKDRGVLKVSINTKGSRQLTKRLQLYNYSLNNLRKVDKSTRLVNPIIEKQIDHTGSCINVSEEIKKS